TAVGEGCVLKTSRLPPRFFWSATVTPFAATSPSLPTVSSAWIHWPVSAGVGATTRLVLRKVGERNVAVELTTLLEIDPPLVRSLPVAYPRKVCVPVPPTFSTNPSVPENDAPGANETGPWPTLRLNWSLNRATTLS